MILLKSTQLFLQNTPGQENEYSNFFFETLISELNIIFNLLIF